MRPRSHPGGYFFFEDDIDLIAMSVLTQFHKNLRILVHKTKLLIELYDGPGAMSNQLHSGQNSQNVLICLSSSYVCFLLIYKQVKDQLDVAGNQILADEAFQGQE